MLSQIKVYIQSISIYKSDGFSELEDDDNFLVLPAIHHTRGSPMSNLFPNRLGISTLA